MGGVALIEAERAILDDLEETTRALGFELFDYAAMVTDGTLYVPTVPSYTVPWKSGRRTPEQQHSLYLRGLSKLDGYRRRSMHQHGRAFHIGLRNKADGRFLRYRTRSMEADQVFLLIVDKARKMGLVWGGDWRSFPDWHHFENPLR